MKFIEFGKENKELMVLLHGGLAALKPELFAEELIRVMEE